jgi:hypothetical protein
MKPEPAHLKQKTRKGSRSKDKRFAVVASWKFHSGDSHNPCLLKTLAEFVSPAGKKRNNCTEISANPANFEGFNGEKGAGN